MKRKTNMTMHVKICFAAFVSLVAASVAARDMRDGLVAWWTPLGDLNGNGRVDADEFYDRINYSTAENPSVAGSVGHLPDSASPIVHSRRDYIDSLQAYHVDANLLGIQAPCTFDEGGSFVSGEPQTVTLPDTGVDISGSFSLMIRFYSGSRLCKNASDKWDNIHLLDYRFLQNRYSGLAMVLVPYGTGDTPLNESYFSVLFRANDKGQAFSMARTDAGIYQPGYWYDFCVTVDANVPEAGKSRVRLMVRRNTFKSRGDDHTAMVGTKVAEADYNSLLELPSSSHSIVLGNRSDTAAATTTTDPNVMARQYKGDIAFVKIWNRAISQNEFEQACTDGNETLWCLGARNGAGGEFSNNAAAEVYEPATMPWHRFRKSLASGDSASIKFCIPGSEVTNAFDRVLQVKAAGSGGFQSGSLDVSLNGVSIGTMAVTAGGDSLFLVKGKHLDLQALSEVGGTYPVTLTLTRTDGGVGDLVFDYLELHGWQLGVADNSYFEFPRWANPWTTGRSIYAFTDYYTCVRDLSAMSGQMQGSGSWTNQTMRFFVTKAMAENCGFKYMTRSVGGGNYRFYLNGDLVCEETLANRQAYTIPFQKDVVVEGMNTLRITRTNSGNDSTGFDFHRLVPVKAWRDRGMILYFR